MLFRSSAAAALVLLAGSALATPQSQEVFFGQPPLVQKEEILRQVEAFVKHFIGTYERK